MDSSEDYSDIKVVVADEAEVREAVENALATVDCTWEELQGQARAGRFETERARMVWFAVSSLVEPSPA